MPHIVIEYSQNLEQDVKEKQVLALAHKTVVDSGLFSPEAVKARGVAYTSDAYVLPEGATQFIHTTVSILTGREVAQRNALADSVFATLKAALPEVEKLSVDIHEMEKETYRK